MPVQILDGAASRLRAVIFDDSSVQASTEIVNLNVTFFQSAFSSKHFLI
jgi:hypothetical protein